MRSLLAGLLLALTAAPASAGSTVHVTGRVLDGAGQPVRGAHVSFELHPDGNLYNERDCPVRPWEIQCRVHRVAGTTDASGRYRLPVRLSSHLASPKKHVLVVTDRAVAGAVAPAQTQVYVYFARKSVEVVDLRVWRARTAAEPSGPVHRVVHVDPLTTAYGRLYSTGPTAELLQGGDVAWSFDAVTEDRRVDARTVEWGTNGVRGIDTAIIGALVVTYRSTTYQASGGARPLSRGAACFTYGREDAVLPLPGCRFTDGRLATPISQTYQHAGGKSCDVASQCDHPRWVLVDLGAVQPVSAVAVRGCVPAAAEVSVEGTHYLPYPTRDLGDGLLVGPPLPARYVRVDLAKCVFKATEVSVF